MRRSAAAFASVFLFAAVCSVPHAEATRRAAGDFVYVSKQVQLAKMSAGNVVALCPAGTAAIGAGGGVTERGIRPTMVSPFDGNDGDLDEDDGAVARGFNASNQRKALKVVAVCSRGADIADLSYNRATQALGSNSGGGFASASCDVPASQETVGGGAGVIENPYDRLVISHPFTTGWQFGIRGTSPVARDSVGVVVCLPATNRTVTIVQRVADFKVDERRTIRVKCPPGSRATDGGLSGGILFNIERTVPFDSGDPGEAPDDGWQVTARNVYEDTPQDGTFSAVCVGPLP